MKTVKRKKLIVSFLLILNSNVLFGMEEVPSIPFYTQVTRDLEIIRTKNNEVYKSWIYFGPKKPKDQIVSEGLHKVKKYVSKNPQDWNPFNVLKSGAKNFEGIPDSNELFNVKVNFCLKRQDWHPNSLDYEGFTSFFVQVVHNSGYLLTRNNEDVNNLILCRAFYESLKILNFNGKADHGPINKIDKGRFLELVSNKLKEVINSNLDKKIQLSAENNSSVLLLDYFSPKSMPESRPGSNPHPIKAFLGKIFGNNNNTGTDCPESLESPESDEVLSTSGKASSLNKKAKNFQKYSKELNAKKT